MKYLIHTVLFILMLILLNSAYGMATLKLEDPSFRKQTGFISFGNQSLSFRSPAIYFQNESMLYRNVMSLNKELGLDCDYFRHPVLSETRIFRLYTNIAIEPRWYYKEERRRNIDISKQVRYSPFLSLKINAFLPLGLSYYSYPEYNKVYYRARISPSRVSVALPRWGAQGNISDLLYYEFGLGVVYFYRFNMDDLSKQTTMTKGFLPDLFLRIGVRLY